MTIQHNELPLRGNINLIYILSILITILMTIASVVGLLYRTNIYPTEDMLRSFIPNDVVNLTVGLSILLGSMWLTWRGKWIGLLCWPGVPASFALHEFISILGLGYSPCSIS